MKLHIPRFKPAAKYKGIMNALGGAKAGKRASVKKSLAKAQKTLSKSGGPMQHMMKELKRKLRKVSPKAALAVLTIKRKKAAALKKPPVFKKSKK